MAIVSNSFSLGIVQRDGRVNVVELHTDNTGATHRIEYLGNPNDDHATVMTARAITLDEQLKASEVERILSALSAPVPRYVTKAALLLVWREQFRDARRERAAQLAKWILDHLDAGEWTDAQLRILFNATITQYNAIKARLVDMRAQWNELQTAQGE